MVLSENCFTVKEEEKLGKEEEEVVDDE